MRSVGLGGRRVIKKFGALPSRFAVDLREATRTFQGLAIGSSCYNRQRHKAISLATSFWMMTSTHLLGNSSY